MGQEKNISSDGFLHAGGGYVKKSFVAKKPTIVNVVPKATGVGAGAGNVFRGTVQNFPQNNSANLPVSVVPQVTTNPTVGVGANVQRTAGIMAFTPTNEMQGNLMSANVASLLNPNSPVVPPVIDVVYPPVVNPVAPPQAGGGGGGGGGSDTSGGAEVNDYNGNQEVASDDAIIDDSHDELSGELEESSTSKKELKGKSDNVSIEKEDSKMGELKRMSPKENEFLASVGLSGITNREVFIVASIVAGIILIRIATK